MTSAQKNDDDVGRLVLRRAGDVIQGLAVLAIVGLAVVVIDLRIAVSNQVVASEAREKALSREIKSQDEFNAGITRKLEAIDNRLTTGGCNAARCQAIEDSLGRGASRLVNLEQTVGKLQSDILVLAEKTGQNAKDIEKFNGRLNIIDLHHANESGRKAELSPPIIGATPQSALR